MHVYFFIAGVGVKPWQLDTDWIAEENKAILRRIQVTLEEKAGNLKCDDFVALVSERLNPTDEH
jgi:hypothetical protein